MPSNLYSIVLISESLPYLFFSFPSHPDKSSRSRRHGQLYALSFKFNSCGDYFYFTTQTLPFPSALGVRRKMTRPLNGEISHRDSGATGYGPFRLVCVWRFFALLISTNPRSWRPGIMLGAKCQALVQYGTRVVHPHVLSNHFLSGPVFDKKCRTHSLQPDLTHRRLLLHLLSSLLSPPSPVAPGPSIGDRFVPEACPAIGLFRQ